MKIIALTGQPTARSRTAKGGKLKFQKCIIHYVTKVSIKKGFLETHPVRG